MRSRKEYICFLSTASSKMPGSVHPEDESMVDAQPLGDEEQQAEGLEAEDEQEVFENDRQRITIVSSSYSNLYGIPQLIPYKAKRRDRNRGLVPVRGRRSYPWKCAAIHNYEKVRMR